MALSSKNLSLFYSQLRTMIHAGISVQNALVTLHKTSSSSMQSILAGLSAVVGRGEPLHSALACFPKKFDPFDAHILGLCEKSGALEQGLSSLARYHEKKAQAQKQLISASIFPTLIFVFAIFLIHLPQFILGQLGETTYSLFQYLRDTVGFLSLVLLVIFVGYRLFVFLLGLPACGLFLDDLIRRLPIFGPLRFGYALYRWVESIRILLTAGFGVVQALEQASGLSRSLVIAHAYSKARPLINNPYKVSEALNLTGIFPPMFIQFWSTGEESGKMDEMLQKLSDHYEAEWQRSLKILSDWLPRIFYAAVSIFLVYHIFKMFMGYLKVLNEAINLEL